MLMRSNSTLTIAGLIASIAWSALPFSASEAHAAQRFVAPVYRAPVYRPPVYRPPVYRAPVYRAPVRTQTYRAPAHRPSVRVQKTRPVATTRPPVRRAGPTKSVHTHGQTSKRTRPPVTQPKQSAAKSTTNAVKATNNSAGLKTQAAVAIREDSCKYPCTGGSTSTPPGHTQQPAPIKVGGQTLPKPAGSPTPSCRFTKLGYSDICADRAGTVVDVVDRNGKVYKYNPAMAWEDFVRWVDAQEKAGASASNQASGSSTRSTNNAANSNREVRSEQRYVPPKISNKNKQNFDCSACISSGKQIPRDVNSEYCHLPITNGCSTDVAASYSLHGRKKGGAGTHTFKPGETIMYYGFCSSSEHITVRSATPASHTAQPDANCSFRPK